MLYYQSMHPDHPWLTRTANEILESYLKKTDVGLEFGSGRSTIWLAKHMNHLTSVEHNLIWGVKVRKMLDKNFIVNVDYKIIPMDLEEDQGDNAAYVRVTENIKDNSLDFCLVDGVNRDYCARRVIEKIRPGGLLVIDNVNWFLPSNTKSPNSIGLAEEPRGLIWKEVDILLSNWRRIWTTSGVTDTCIFFKPFK